MSQSASEIVSRFQAYLRIKTVHPNPDYKGCCEFLLKLAKRFNIPATVFEPVPNKPFVIMTIEGKQKELASLMLYSHTDENMKCVGMAYLEALNILLSVESWKPERTIHVVFGPDEEIGGEEGVRHWVDMQHFRDLGVGFVLDEGISCPGNALRVFYAERSPWWVWIKATGNVGHGSQFITDPAPAKLIRVLNKFLMWRDVQENLFKFGTKSDGSKRKLDLGDVTTVNLTMLKAGVQFNVVPGEAWGGLDIRVSPWVDLKGFEGMIADWCNEEDGVTYSFAQKFDSSNFTDISDSNPWFVALKEVAAEHKCEILPEVFPAATDSRFIRKLNIPALGISYLKNLEPLLHQHNEYIPVNLFLESIPFYKDLIRKLADL
ncbi:adenylate cyclase [Irineochytrium annulatum]|nr:adenylate cyclase [Irineochytrium annulatum]